MPKTTMCRIAELGRELPSPSNSFVDVIDSPLTHLPQRVLLVCREDQGGHIAQAHHRLVWMILLEGAGSVLVEGQILEVRPGQSVLVLPLQSHCRLHLDQPGRWLIATFELADTTPLEPLRKRTLPHSDALAETIYRMVHAYHQAGPVSASAGADGGSATFAPLYLAMAMQYLLEQVRLMPVPAVPVAGGGSNHLVREATTFIATHIEQPLYLDSMCEALGVSETQLRRILRETFGLTPKQLILKMKMHRAVQMLSLEGVNVKNVARRLGFASPYAFSRAFRRVTGRTAKSYKPLSSGAGPAMIAPR